MKRIFLIALGFIVIASCTKLDEKVYDKIPGDEYPENDAQVANLAVNAYSKLRTYADDEGWWFLAQIMTGDLVCGPTRGADWYDGIYAVFQLEVDKFIEGLPVDATILERRN